MSIRALASTPFPPRSSLEVALRGAEKVPKRKKKSSSLAGRSVEGDGDCLRRTKKPLPPPHALGHALALALSGCNLRGAATAKPAECGPRPSPDTEIIRTCPSHVDPAFCSADIQSVSVLGPMPHAGRRAQTSQRPPPNGEALRLQADAKRPETKPGRKAGPQLKCVFVCVCGDA